MNNINNYLHFLKDTIILLGGELDIANILSTPNNITESEISQLRNYNASLVDKTKDKLANINYVKIKVGNKT